VERSYTTGNDPRSELGKGDGSDAGHSK
jgi:hypothetical protein